MVTLKIRPTPHLKMVTAEFHHNTNPKVTAVGETVGSSSSSSRKERWVQQQQQQDRPLGPVIADETETVGQDRWTRPLGPHLTKSCELLNCARHRCSLSVNLDIIIKTSCTVPSGKNKIVHKLFMQPHKRFRDGKLKKTQLREATITSLHLDTSPTP